ncbi:MAG TPA: hypothetical protein VGQ38_20710 [Gaiellaceae bacterium]|nr:hypothetical protein [Gaiellaceae bacterium]
MTVLGSTIDAYVQAMTYGLGALVMVAIGMSRKRLQWRPPGPKKRRHWPWRSSGA